MTKKYVLTGGPGTGKSSILLALEQRGEYIVREAAEDYIRLRQAQGQPEPWTETDFQNRILELQIQREARIEKGIERAFIDRGLADGLAYAQAGTETYERIKQAAEKAGYEKIFLVEDLGKTEKTEIRREDHEEAVRLGKKLEKIYQEKGYEVSKIPAGTVEERAEKVLAEIE